MFSKALRLCLFIPVIFLSSCDGFLKNSKSGEERQKTNVVEVNPGDLVCLREFPDQVGGYLKDQADAATVNKAASCLDMALRAFVKITKGARPDHYTDEELRYFMNRYLLKHNQMEVPFMQTLMKIKVFIVGGTDQELTRIEIEKVQKFLTLLKDEALNLRGNLRYLLYKGKDIDRGLPSDADVTKLVEQTKISLSHLIQESKAVGTMYEFQDFVDFTHELKIFLGERDSSLDRVLDWVPMLAKVKTLFWGAWSAPTSHRAWVESSRWTIDGYFLSLNYFYYFRHQTLNTTTLWQRLIDMMDRGIDLIERSPILERGGHLDLEVIDQVLAEIWKMKSPDTLEAQMPLEIVKKTYRMAIRRLLNHPGVAPVPPLVSGDGLERKHLSVLRFEFNVWKWSQEMILELFNEFPEGRVLNQGLTQNQILAAVDHMNVDSLLKNQVRLKFPKESEENLDLLVASMKDWFAILKQDRPLQWTESAKLSMQYDAAANKNSFVGLNWTNAFRTATRFVLRGYGKGTSALISELQVSEDGVVNLEEDFREMGRELGLLDRRSTTSAKRTFKEASFFTFNGNGDAGLSSLEILEELSIMISGGRITTTEIHNAALAEPFNCGTKIFDVMGKEILKQKCFNDFIVSHLAVHISNLKGMSEEFRSLSPVEKQEFINSLLEVGGQVDNGKDQIESVIIRNAIVVLHYVESLVVVYDKDRNGLLNEEELSVAAPRFRSFIMTLSPLKSYFVDEIFLCMVYKGKKPDAADLFKFKFAKMFGLGEVRRNQLIKVLAILKKDASK